MIGYVNKLIGMETGPILENQRHR